MRSLRHRASPTGSGHLQAKATLVRRICLRRQPRRDRAFGRDLERLGFFAAFVEIDHESASEGEEQGSPSVVSDFLFFFILMFCTRKLIAIVKIRATRMAHL